VHRIVSTKSPPRYIVSCDPGDTLDSQFHTELKPRHQTFSVSTGHVFSFQLPIYGPTSLVDLGPLFSFLIYTYSMGLLGRGDQPVARPLPTHRTTQTQNKHTQISMPRVVFEPLFPFVERAKTAHALDRAATVIGFFSNC
jgi:hypothetical protein